jgi:NAD(P)-dependent dehydrogenase (short-subunit alcohol dehydrogenase family)
VTGANRGLGSAFVQALRDAGCTKIYAAARTIEGAACNAVVEPVQLDITKIGQVSSAATRCHDVGILINNAGVARFVPALGAPTMDDARLEIETNYLGTLAMCRAFAPVLKRNGGGVLVNMLSVVSFFNERLATSEKTTIVVERQPDDKMRVTSGSWNGEKVFLGMARRCF